MTTSETAIRLYTSREIAAILHVKPAVMDIYAGNGTGPPYRKVGKFRYYPEDAFRAWFDSHPGGGEWEKHQAPHGAGPERAG